MRSFEIGLLCDGRRALSPGCQAGEDEVALNLEERKNPLTSMAKTAVHQSLKRSTLQRLGETQGYIDRIRGMLLAPQSDGPDETLIRVRGLMAEPRKAKPAREDR